MTSFWTPYWLKHLMESFTIFTSSAMVVIISHIMLYYFPQQHYFAKWQQSLGMTCSLRYTNSIWNKETEIKINIVASGIYWPYIFISLPWTFSVLYLSFFLCSRILFHRKWCGINKVVNFKDFARPYKEIKYFSRTLFEFKDLSRWRLNSNTFQHCTNHDIHMQQLDILVTHHHLFPEVWLLEL